MALLICKEWKSIPVNFCDTWFFRKFQIHGELDEALCASLQMMLWYFFLPVFSLSHVPLFWYFLISEMAMDDAESDDEDDEEEVCTPNQKKKKKKLKPLSSAIDFTDNFIPVIEILLIFLILEIEQFTDIFANVDSKRFCHVLYQVFGCMLLLQNYFLVLSDVNLLSLNE